MFPPFMCLDVGLDTAFVRIHTITFLWIEVRLISPSFPKLFSSNIGTTLTFFLSPPGPSLRCHCQSAPHCTCPIQIYSPALGMDITALIHVFMRSSLSRICQLNAKKCVLGIFGLGFFWWGCFLLLLGFFFF